MEKYCKNCGTKISENDEFCPDCGTTIDNDTITCEHCGRKLKKDSKFCPNCGNPTKALDRFCPNCGSSIEPNQEFCSECGTNINAPVKAKDSFMEKHREKVIIAGVVLGLIVILLIASSLFITNAPVDVGTQNVEVGSTNFIIPGDFRIDPSSIDVDYKYASATFAKGWVNEDGEQIYIGTMTVPYNVDAQDVLSSEGGAHKTLMGHDGYYTEEDGIYNFAFEDGGYICVVSVTSPHLLDEIDCIG